MSTSTADNPADVKPLSDTAANVLNAFLSTQESAGRRFLRYKMEAFDDFVFEGHRGPFFPETHDESVEVTAFVAYQHRVNGDTLHSPELRFFRHGGQWYPFGFRRDGTLARDVRFLTVEDGALTLLELAEKTPKYTYDEVRAYAEDFLPMVHRRYSDAAPTSKPLGADSTP
jgi:hypothetical protein